MLLKSNKKGVSYLTKPEKIYLQNTNLMVAFARDAADSGSARETFFLNQVSRTGTVLDHPEADFTVNDRYVFEVGGKNKSMRQIKNLENAWVVSDNQPFSLRSDKGVLWENFLISERMKANHYNKQRCKLFFWRTT
ncbi:MAG: hypothetical protein WD431_17315, partial [Cyclobacteriaceae bacterium]